MKIVLTESQVNLIVEQEGLDSFMMRMSVRYPDSVYLMDTLSNFIKKSGCQRIIVDNFKIPAYGISLHDKVVINPAAFSNGITYFLYIILHEIAHQYQYKKYGIEKMYGVYTGDVSIEEAAKLIMNTEKIADEFAIRKLREIEKLHGSKLKLSLDVVDKVYDNVPLSHFVELIETTIKLIKEKGYKDKTEISNILYNYVKK